MSQDFFSFEKVLKELQLQEDELKKLVSEGEIRAFRDQDKMKFKKEDVDRFRRNRGNEQAKTVEENVPEELVFDEDDAHQEVGMATAAITDDSFLDEDEAAGEEKAPPTSTRSSRARPTPASAASRKSRTVMLEEPGETEGGMWRAAIILLSLLLVFGAFAAMDAVRATPAFMSEGLANFVGETFLGMKK